MADRVADLTRVLPHRIDGRLGRVEEKIDRPIEIVRDLSIRPAHVEQTLAGVRRPDRIKARFDLVDAPLGVS